MSSNTPASPEQIAQVIEQVQAPTTPNQGMPLEVQIPDTPQVFRGNTPQEVLDQLVRAQSEATRTIQAERARVAELTGQVQTLQQQIPRTPPPDAERTAKLQEHYNLWAQNPTEATKQQLAELMGLPADKVVPAIKTAIESSVVNTAAEEFLARCPEFPQTPQSAALIKSALSQRYGNGMDAATADNLEIVYHQLVREGRLTPNAMPTAATVNGNAPIPNLRGGSAPPNQVNDVLRQIHTMPLEQLKEVIDRASAQTSR